MNTIKLKDYLKSLQKLSEEFPHLLEYPVVYSHDDEGNEFQTVNNLPCPCFVFKIEDGRNLDMVIFEPEEVIEFPHEKSNAILIN